MDTEIDEAFSFLDDFLLGICDADHGPLPSPALALPSPASDTSTPSFFTATLQRESTLRPWGLALRNDGDGLYVQMTAPSSPAQGALLPGDRLLAVQRAALSKDAPPSALVPLFAEALCVEILCARFRLSLLEDMRGQAQGRESKEDVGIGDDLSEGVVRIKQRVQAFLHQRKRQRGSLFLWLVDYLLWSMRDKGSEEEKEKEEA